MSRAAGGPWEWKQTLGRNGGNRSVLLQGPARRILIVKPGTITPDTETAELIAAAPAFAVAWELVPEEIRQRIFDALHKPDTEWVEKAIAAAISPRG
jgi:hypothetical protein